MTVEASKDKQLDRLRLVKMSYWKGFVGSVVGVGAAYGIACWINSFHMFGEEAIRLLQAVSVVPAYAALFGVRGYDIQTWCGKSPAELLNQKLFKFISIIGLLLPVIAFSLTAPRVNEAEMENRILEKLKIEFHAKYGGFEGMIGLSPIRQIEGNLPPRVLGLVIEWATMYSKELTDAWHEASKGQSIPKVPPLV